MPTQKKVLIIGNGFDLYHELPTKYTQFIQVLKNIENIKLSDSNDVLFEELFFNIERIDNIKEKYDVKNIIFEKDNIEKIKKSISNNVWYKLFKDKLDFENWIDFENEIKETLNNLSGVILKINNHLITRIDTQKIFASHLRYDINSLQINKKEINYLIRFGLIKEISSDYFEFDYSFFDKYHDSLIKINSGKIYETAFSELNVFADVFYEYLSKIAGTFYGNILSDFSDNFDKINTKIDEFYTFNYTPTLENFYNVKNKINYLHGKIKNTDHNIVLGINGIEKDFKDDRILMFTKYYQKLFNNTDYSFLNHISVDNSDVYSFIIFGHSLSENDKSYVEEIFSKSENKKSKIYVFYISLSDKSQKLKNLLNIIGKETIERYMKNNKLEFVYIHDKSISEVLNQIPKSTSDFR